MVEKFSKHTPDQIVHGLKKTRQKRGVDIRLGRTFSAVTR